RRRSGPRGLGRKRAAAPRPSGPPVLAGPADQRVVALQGAAVALELVVAGAAIELVGAALALEQVAVVGSRQHVVAVGADLVVQRERLGRGAVGGVLAGGRLRGAGIVGVGRARPGVAPAVQR